MSHCLKRKPCLLPKLPVGAKHHSRQRSVSEFSVKVPEGPLSIAQRQQGLGLDGMTTLAVAHCDSSSNGSEFIKSASKCSDR